jgi:chromosome segregation ATPase
MARKNTDQTAKPAPQAQRIDPPHALTSATAAEEAVAQDAGQTPALLVRQLRTQATQLARHLAGHQGDLDRRESELNARVAGIENEVRAARLWLSERQSELAEREKHLAAGTLAVGANSESDAGGNEVHARRAADLDQIAARLAAERADVEQRHRELDARQAQVYLDIEEHSQSRARLAAEQAELEQLRADIAARQIEFDAWREELAVEAAKIGSQRAALNLRKSELDGAADDLTLRESKLADRHREIETALARFERLGVTEEKMEQVQQQAAEHHARQRYLEDAEALLSVQQADLASARRRFENDCARHEERVERNRGDLAKERKCSEEEIARQRDAVRRRADQLDVREAAIEQLQADVAHAQRETLEMRLASEELWAQLSGPLAPASLTRSLSQIRQKLADHYRSIDGELDERKEELKKLTADLSEQHGKLAQQKDELLVWAERRREEIEAQAARLVAREQELDRQEAHFRDREICWQEERRTLQRETQQLLAQLRVLPAAA